MPFVAQTLEIPCPACRALAPRPLCSPFDPLDFLAGCAAPRAAGASRGPHADWHRSALCAPRAMLASRAHREPLAPPAAASRRAESALRSPRVTIVVKWEGG